MKDEFEIHNLFWKNIIEFGQFDPHLIKLKDLPFIHYPRLIEEIPVLIQGIYILTGGRQVGKSTLIKLIIKNLLHKKSVLPENMYYIPCDTILDFKELLSEIEQFVQEKKNSGTFVIFLDEINYVKEWERAIKSLADSGFLHDGSIVITGSDSFLLKKAMMEFPGRRGEASKQDFHLNPISFYEFVNLKNAKMAEYFNETRKKFIESLKISFDIEENKIALLQDYFKEYLLTGGYLRAINNYEIEKKIKDSVYKTYIQWVIGDFLKRGKSENYLKEIIKELIPRLASQITWHDFASKTSIDHHQTVIDYIDLLSRMDVIVILQALIEDKLTGAPKKAKKVHFCDPFIFHALHGWIKNENNIFELAVKTLKEDSSVRNILIEGLIASIFNRNSECYYIKSEKEVDLAIINNNNFFPVEIKNSLFVDKHDLKQILKYKNGLVGYGGLSINKMEQLDLIPIPLLALIAA